MDSNDSELRWAYTTETFWLLQDGFRRLNAHMHRKLIIVPSPTCPCSEEDQTTEHVLQRCNRYQQERIAQWPSASLLHQKLYGPLGGPEEDHQLHHCFWTGRVGEREEEDFVK